MRPAATADSGETRVTIALNSLHPSWVRRRFHDATPRLLDRLRLLTLEEPPAQGTAGGGV
jgi:hypothetical protein